MIFSKVYDRHNECSAWSAMDECKKSNWTWMVDHCPRSCDVPCKWQFSYRKKLYFITWENKVWNLVKNDICGQEISNILHFSRVAMSWHFWQYLGTLGNCGKKSTVINIYRIPHNVNVVLHQSIFSDICTFRLYPFCTLSSIRFYYFLRRNGCKFPTKICELSTSWHHLTLFFSFRSLVLRRKRKR